MSGITQIKRDEAYSPYIVRIVAENTLAEVGTTGYLTAQEANIVALNEGEFQWEVSDMVLVYASDGWGFFQIDPGFASLIPFVFGGSVVGAPVVVGDFAVFQSTSGNLEDLGYLPSDASKTRVVMAGSAVQVGYLAHFIDTAGTIDDTAGAVINAGTIQSGLSGTVGGFLAFPAGATSGSLRLTAVTNASGNFNTTISNASAILQSQVISIPDSGAATANFILSSGLGSQTVAFSSSSATPGTVRSLIGKATLSNATYANTTNSVAGVRGEIDYVGISSGFLYGVQGKLIPTGTIAGSGWNAGVFGQFDISGATINAGQMATIWGDYGATSGTLTDQTGLYGIAMTNTTAAVLAGQLYLYGGAQNLLLLNTNAGLSGVTYFINSGVSAGSWGNATPPTPTKVLRISVDGTQYYLPLVAQNT